MDRQSDRGERMIDFIQTLKIPEGMLTGSPFLLRDWQQNIIREVYNPVYGDGFRICRKAIYSVAKKQGKTPIVAALALGHLVGPEAKINEQIYSAAFDRDQAAITFRYMTQMILSDEELSDELNIRESVKEIYCPRNGSIFKALSSEIKGKHGLGPAVLIMDELAQFGADRTFYDTLNQGQGAHAEPILWIISTQAADDLAVLSQEIDYALKIHNGEIEDPTVKLFFFTTPKELDPFEPENWKLSNPALGDFLNIKDMELAARTAKNMPSAENNFRNLRLNQRISAVSHFLSPEIWKSCGDAPDKTALEHGRIYAGLDLSSKNDLTALVLNAVYEGCHNIFPYFWTPKDNIRERSDRDRVPYDMWVEQGVLNTVPGKTIDYKFVSQKVAEIHEAYHIYELRFDRWRIEDFLRELSNCECETYLKFTRTKDGKVVENDPPSENALALVPFGQGYKDMTPAVEAVEDLAAETKIRHGNHPVLTMCASNTVIQKNPAGSRKFAKDKSIGRIDGMVAMAMACTGAELPDIDNYKSVYSERGFREL